MAGDTILVLQNRPSEVTNDGEKPTDAAQDVKALAKKQTFGILISAILAIVIGVIVQATAGVKSVPSWVVPIVGIPGTLWMRALSCVVTPLIWVSMVLAVQNMKGLREGSAAKMVKTTVAYYLSTTFIAIIEGIILCSVLLLPNLEKATDQQLEQKDASIIPSSTRTVVEQVTGLFTMFIPSNLFAAFHENELIGVIVIGIVIGALIKKKDSMMLYACREIEEMVIAIVTFLISLAPYAVFFLILPSVLGNDLLSLGKYFLFLIAGSAIGIAFHVSVVYPLIYFSVTRKNPFSFYSGCVPAMVTALGTSSSAATLPMTLKCADGLNLPIRVTRFTLPLGATINMDGTGIYFPVSVVFLAVASGKTLEIVDFVMIALISTLASIGATPIPSAGLVLIIMIAQQVNVEVTGMFGVVVAVDWLVDRLCTACNITGDLVGAAVISKISGVTDDEESFGDVKDM